MKNLSFLLSALLFPALLPAQSNITEAEARVFMDRYLQSVVISALDEEKGEEPESFFDTDFQQMLDQEELYLWDFFFRARVYAVDPPWVEVLASTENEGYWDRILRFRLEKKKRQLTLQPLVARTWLWNQASSYHDETVVRIPFSGEELHQWKSGLRTMLEERYPSNPEDARPDSLLWGDWEIRQCTFCGGLFSGWLGNYHTLQLAPDGTLRQLEARAPSGDWLAAGGRLALRTGTESIFRIFEMKNLQNGNIWLSVESGEGLLLGRSKVAQQEEAVGTLPLPEALFTIVCQPQYDDINCFSQGRALVKRAGRYGYIDLSGKEIIPAQFDKSGQYFGESGLVFASRDGRSMMIDTLGQVLREYDYDEAIHPWGDVLFVKKDGKEGIINTSGVVILPAIYDDINPGGFTYYQVLRENRWGLFDMEGREVLPAIYEAIDFRGENLAIVKQEGQYGFMDIEKKRLLVPCAYDRIEIKGARLVQATRDVKTILFRLDGTRLSSQEYELTTWMGWDFLGVQADGRRGIINQEGAVVIPVVYDDVFYADLSLRGIFKTTLGEEVSLRDSTGRIYSPEELEALGGVTEAAAEQNSLESLEEGNTELEEALESFQFHEKYGFQTPQGEWGIPPIYEYAGYFEKGLAEVKYNGRAGLIDEQGRPVLPFIFDELSYCDEEGLALVKYQGKWGVVKVGE